MSTANWLQLALLVALVFATTPLLEEGVNVLALNLDLDRASPAG
jgi:hypothetical protein